VRSAFFSVWKGGRLGHIIVSEVQAQHLPLYFVIACTGDFIVLLPAALCQIHASISDFSFVSMLVFLPTALCRIHASFSNFASLSMQAYIYHVLVLCDLMCCYSTKCQPLSLCNKQLKLPKFMETSSLPF